MPIVDNEQYLPGARAEAREGQKERAIVAAAKAAYEDFRDRHNATEYGKIKPKRSWEDLPGASRVEIIADTRAAIAAYETEINN